MSEFRSRLHGRTEQAPPPPAKPRYGKEDLYRTARWVMTLPHEYDRDQVITYAALWKNRFHQEVPSEVIRYLRETDPDLPPLKKPEPKPKPAPKPAPKAEEEVWI